MKGNNVWKKISKVIAWICVETCWNLDLLWFWETERTGCNEKELQSKVFEIIGSKWHFLQFNVHKRVQFVDNSVINMRYDIMRRVLRESMFAIFGVFAEILDKNINLV